MGQTKPMRAMTLRMQLSSQKPSLKNQSEGSGEGNVRLSSTIGCVCIVMVEAARNPFIRFPLLLIVVFCCADNESINACCENILNILKFI